MYIGNRVKNKKLYSGIRVRTKDLLHSRLRAKSSFPLATGKIDGSGTHVKETLNKGTEELFKILMVHM